ncbi:hypothetical protein G6F37_005192 [Rhizopus arrhizus]|nr:hypothetical protein G6F38_010648 [Rhizopus arrhizus]KAG1159112.1 hypothetical protein G6F37_005192 [Rhizopus arrhizus]
MKLFSLLSIISLPFVFVLADDKPEIEEGFEKVTCGSIIKLANNVNGYKLHSHSVTYGSGSGQQSVTGFPHASDANSLWVVEAASGHVCRRGEAVRCGSLIRLKHTNTKAYLHSHLHPSPLSKQQEVSCYDGQDSGDDWQVQCTKGDWLREQPVQLIHKDTSAYLTGSEQYQFGQPIPGQLEIAAYKSASKHAYWVAQITVPGPRLSIAFVSLKTATRAEVQRMEMKDPVLKKFICREISIGRVDSKVCLLYPHNTGLF